MYLNEINVVMIQLIMNTAMTVRTNILNKTTLAVSSLYLTRPNKLQRVTELRVLTWQWMGGSTSNVNN